MLPSVPVGNLAQALANKAADIADNGAIALDGALKREWVRENLRPVRIEVGAFACGERADAKCDRITLMLEECVEIRGRNWS